MDYILMSRRSGRPPHRFLDIHRVIDVEVSVTPVRLQQDSGDASVSAVDATSGPEVYFLDPPPPAALLSGSRGVANPGLSDVLRAAKRRYRLHR